MSADPALRAPRWAAPVTLALVVVGLAVATYLTIEHFTTAVALACPDTGRINCAKVTTSSASKLLGIPVAVLGLLWFLALLPLMVPPAWRSRDPRLRLVRLVLVSLGIPFVLWLVYAELFVVHAICLWCTVVHVVAILLFAAVVLAMALEEESERDGRPLRR
jgi:uncharacterized membrane protein